MMNLKVADVKIRLKVKIASIWYVIFAKNGSNMSMSAVTFVRIMLRILDAKNVVMMLLSANVVSRII